MKRENEYQKFDETMRRLVKVSHDEIKAKLDAEKIEKAKKRKKRKADDNRN